MKHILVFAYQISPFAGSEFAVAWDYVKNMSKTNKLTVLYGISEGWLEIGNVKKMREYLSVNELPNVDFVPVLPDESVSRELAKIKKSRYEYYQFYFAYRVYHKLVAKVAAEIIKREKIDIVHYLGPIGYHEPGYLRKLGLPYIWGPIGGVDCAPLHLLPGLYSAVAKVELLAKEAINVFRYTFNRRIREAFLNTDLLLANNSVNARKIKKITGRDDIQVFQENGISVLFPLNEEKFKSEKVECIWVGSLCPRKSLYTLLRSLKLVDANAPILINIVGTGHLMESMKKYAVESGVDHFLKWHGSIPRNEVFALFDKAHLHIITSIKEANTTVIWEAMSKGVPTMSFRHSGMADTINDRNGILIPVVSYKKSCRDMADRLTDLVKNPEKLRKLAVGVLETREQYTWEARCKKWNMFYDMAIEAHNNKK